MSLSPQQISIIKSTVPVLAEHGNTITALFYNNMLTAHPSLFNIFNKTKQVNGHQPRALAGALYAYAANIDNLSALTSAIENITQKHVSLFVQPEQYDIVGKYLLEAMGIILGDALTPEILDAWATAYKQLADILIATEAKIYAATSQWTDWRIFTIARKEKESKYITSFYLKPVDGEVLPQSKPGHYISLRTAVPGFEYLQARQYSLSDAYNGSVYRISVKRDDGLASSNLEGGAASAHPGFISNVLHSMSVGAEVQLSPPHGDFYLSERAVQGEVPVVLVSAGVGVTPVMAMLNALTAKESKQPISWIQAARSVEELPFQEHVRSLVREHGNLRAAIFVKNQGQGEVGVEYKKGRMDLSALDGEKELYLGSEAEYYICGPDSFMEDMKKNLVGLGVNEERVQFESFGAAAGLVA